MGRSPLDLLTAAQLAAFLCVKPGTVRVMIHREGIKPVGKMGRANLYDAREFVNKVGAHDRGIARKRRPLCNNNGQEDSVPKQVAPRRANVRGLAD